MPATVPVIPNVRRTLHAEKFLNSGGQIKKLHDFNAFASGDLNMMVDIFVILDI